jgi:hypothetical protein
MHGTKGSRGIRRYLCSTRRHGHGCEQTITKAEPLETQLVEWVARFEPGEELRALVLASVRAAHRRSGGITERRSELVGHSNGSATSTSWATCQRTSTSSADKRSRKNSSAPDPRLDKVDDVLSDFGRFWDVETEPAERRKLLARLFDRVWQDGGTIVAVKPREPFLRYFRAADELAQRREKKRGVKSGSDGARSQTLHLTKSRSAGSAP